MASLARRTKIISTLGPATYSPALIRRLIIAGVDVFRFNFSHADYPAIIQAMKDVRSVSKKLRKHVAIMADLQGPKIRIGTFKHGSVILKPGQSFTITIDAVIGDEQQVSTTFKDIVSDARKGNIILLDDGRIRLRVVDTDTAHVYTRVVVGGVLSDKKGMNLPRMKLSTTAMSGKDRHDVLFGITQDVDYFALSFVRDPRDIQLLRRMLHKHRSEAKIIAKIEKPEALQQLTAIIEASDGIMVARGDLGVELSLEKVPSVQKDIVRKANFLGKPVIVATQMLESMIQNPIPTRAEVSDVATAIYDKADAVMLSGETAIGKYPVQTVRSMAKVASEVDRGQARRKRKLAMRKTHFLRERTVISSLCDSADELADEVGASALVVFTDTGSTGLLVSKHRASMPILVITDKPIVCRQVNLYRGVIPVLANTSFKKMSGIKEMLNEVDRCSQELGLVRKGELVVMVAGIPIAKAGSTNMIRVHKVGEPL